MGDILTLIERAGQPEKPKRSPPRGCPVTQRWTTSESAPDPQAGPNEEALNDACIGQMRGSRKRRTRSEPHRSDVRSMTAERTSVSLTFPSPPHRCGFGTTVTEANALVKRFRRQK